MTLLKIRSITSKAQEEPRIEALAKDQLGVSAEAAAHILRLASLQEEPPAFLRVAIRGGGCSGLSLHYEFATSKTERDQVFSAHGVSVIIDAKSLSLLGGATLHVREYLGTYEFILVNNPVAKQCSCGKSFSL